METLEHSVECSINDTAKLVYGIWCIGKEIIPRSIVTLSFTPQFQFLHISFFFSGDVLKAHIVLVADRRDADRVMHGDTRSERSTCVLERWAMT